MNIKNIFDMARADKYTKDGREEIIKAQETEDARRYKTGEISEATGLQKQPDGSWAPPKGGAGSSANKEAAKEKTFTFTKAGHVYNVPASSPAEAVQKLNSRGVKGFKESDAFDNSTPRSATGSSSMSAPKNAGRGDMLKIGNQSVRIERAEQGRYGNELGTLLQYTDPETKKNGYVLQTKTGELKEADADGNVKSAAGSTGNGATKLKGQKLNEVTTRDSVRKRYTALRKDAMGDAAPRELTGDTRLTLSQVKDARRTYKIGEISEKTGLQKTANGWVEPKKGAPKGAKKLTRQDNTIFKGNDARELNNNVQAAAGGKRDISAENRAYHEKVEKERADRNARAQKSAQTAIQEAKSKGYTGETLKDFMLAKTYEGSSVSITQRGMEAQGWSLTKGEDGLNVYEKPDGSKVTMQLEGNKVKSAEYQPAGSKDEPKLISSNTSHLDAVKQASAFFDQMRKQNPVPEVPAGTESDTMKKIKESNDFFEQMRKQNHN